MNSRSFFYDFGRALYHVDSFYDEFAKQSNVSSALLWVLYALNDGNSHTQIEISNDWELPKTTVNTVIKEIQKNGYVDLIPKGKGARCRLSLQRTGRSMQIGFLLIFIKKRRKYIKLLAQMNMQ